MIQHKIFHSVSELPADWDILNNNLFLNADFLKVQETSSPIGMKFFYIAFYSSAEIVGKTCFQWIDLNLGKNDFDTNWVQNLSSKFVNRRVLTIGNALTTGQNSFGKSNKITLAELINATEFAIADVLTLLKKENLKPHHIIYKDFYEEVAKTIKTVLPKSYIQQKIEPNMVLNIRPEWQTFQDYLAALKTKYRTRTKRAFKKSEEIVFKELSVREVQSLNNRIYELYRQVVDALDFVAYYLPENFFENYKTVLKHNFKIFGGFYQNELVAFYSLMPNSSFLESGYIGYQYNIQKEFQLYNTMLYKMVEFAIDNKFRQLILSRSAIEIKSSIGAEPVDMYGFAKLNNWAFKPFAKTIYSNIYSTQDFTIRSPFK